MTHGTGPQPPATETDQAGGAADGRRLTGERPMQGVTPDSLLALHAAGYRTVIERLGDGPMLDVGCGQGFESVRFVSENRPVFGADYSAEAVDLANRRWSDGRPPGGPDERPGPRLSPPAASAGPVPRT